MNSILLTVADSQTFGGTTVHAFELIEHRLSRGLWPIFRRTPLQKEFSFDVDFWIYAGGKGEIRRAVCARFRASKSISWGHADGSVDPENVLTDSPTSCLKIEAHEIISPPISMLNMVDKLALFEKNRRMWWVFLQGGARRLPSGDATLLEAASKNCL